MGKKEFNVLSILVHMGIPEDVMEKETENAFNMGVDAIVGQGNGTDWGPYWHGDPNCEMDNRVQCKSNTRFYVNQALKHKIPFVFSTGTPSGHNRHLNEALDDIDDIAREDGINFKAAVVRGEINKEYIIEKLEKGEKMRRVVDSPKLKKFLTVKDVEEATYIVAQMGAEPIQKALKMDVDGVFLGRALDVGLHMAPLLNAGFDKGIACHMAKTIECAGICLEGRSTFNSVYATIMKDGFKVTSPDSEGKGATIKSVAGHALYERRDPFKEENPGFYLDLSEARHEQIDARTVKVTGGKCVDVSPYTLKIEGARFVGYRSASIFGIRDSKVLDQLDWILEDVKKKAYAYSYAKDLRPDIDYTLRFRVYGRDAVLGSMEPTPVVGHEVGVVMEIIGPSQDFCDQFIQYAYGLIAYGSFPGKRTTSGNIETPYSPHFFKLPGEYRFNVWHLMELEDPCEPFKFEIIEFPRKKRK